MTGPLGDVVAYLGEAASWSGPGGLGARIVEHLWVSLLAMLLACAVALPVAVWLGHRRRGGTVLINLGNAARAVPTFAVLVLFVLMPAPFGGNTFSFVGALALFALPPLLTNTYVGVSEVDRDIVEAGRGMGMSEGELLTRVELPLALPLILTGLRIALVQVIATATVIGMVGGGALGRTIVAGFDRQDQGMVIGGAVVVALVALAAEGVGAALEWPHPVSPEDAAPAAGLMPRRPGPGAVAGAQGPRPECGPVSGS